MIVFQFLCYLGNPGGSCCPTSLFITRKYSLITVSIRLPGTNIHKMCYRSGSLASIKELQFYLLFVAEPKPAFLFQMRNAFPLVTLGWKLGKKLCVPCKDKVINLKDHKTNTPHDRLSQESWWKVPAWITDLKLILWHNLFLILLPFSVFWSFIHVHGLRCSQVNDSNLHWRAPSSVNQTIF